MNVHALTFCLNKDSTIFLTGRDSGQLTLQSAMEYRLAHEFSHCYSQQLVKGSQNISSVPTEGVVPPSSETYSSAMEEQESRRLMTCLCFVAASKNIKNSTSEVLVALMCC